MAQQVNDLNNENQSSINQKLTPLAQVLNSDGTINQNTSEPGSFDVRGYEMTYGENGEPVFLPKEGDSKATGDENWSSEFQGPPGAGGTVYAVVKDASNNIYIGGNFTVVFGTAANRIAKWNGSTWSGLGTSLAGTGVNNTVKALAIDGSGNVYAGGQFTTAGGVSAKYVAKWNGSVWSGLGTGMNSDVLGLAIDGSGNVYAGGQFTSAGGVANTNYIAKWNGSAWTALGTGMNGYVYALAIGGSGNVYAGGNFSTVGGVAANYIAKWNGSAWAALGTGMDNSVNSLVIDGSGNVYAGGMFITAGGVTVNCIAKWNVSSSLWSALGTGMLNWPNALAIDGSGNVYAGGQFTIAGGVSANYIAKWNGSAWSALGTGLANTVNALAIDVSGNVYAGGNFKVAGEVAANYIAKWSGSVWSALGSGMNAAVDALAIDGSGNVYAGGSFTSAGGVLANSIAKWDGSVWSALGTGITGSTNDVRALAIDGSGNVYAGGGFTSAGGVSAKYIAKWNGSAWSALGTGMNSYVYALAVDGFGNVYAGGEFTLAGGVSANDIAKWNGTAWSALGTGMDNAIMSVAYDGSGNIYAGGYFTTAGGVSANGVAKWDGTVWSALGTGITGGVLALAIDGSGNVYAGGLFTTAGGVAASKIAKWNGSAWSALGTGIGGQVWSLAVDGSGNVYAGGIFSAAGVNYDALNIAKWNGSDWSKLGSGTDNYVYDIKTYNKLVYCGGAFMSAGGKNSAYFGKYTNALTFTWDGSVSSAWNTAGNWDMNAVPTAYDNAIIANAGTAPVITTSVEASCANITVNTGASLTINSGGSFITTGTITNLGTINIKRDISEESWHLVSIPTFTANANVFLGDYLQGYDESNSLWSEIIPAVTPLAPVYGYALWATYTPGKGFADGGTDFSYTFTGTPNTGGQSLAFTAVNDYGWNLMGNPYPSYLDWDAVIASQTNMNGGVYFYDGSTYVSYNNGIGGGSRYIAPMQGFFISATANGTFNLTNSHRTHTSGTFLKEKEIPDHYLRLTTTGNNITDELHIRLNAIATPDFDGQYDAWKLLSWNEQAPQLYSFTGSDMLSIDQRPACEMIQLGFSAAIAGVYSFAVNEMIDFSTVTLEDTKTNTFRNMQNGPYEFVWDATDSETRFKLHLNVVGIEETPNSGNNILIYAANNQIFIKGAENGEVMVSDVMGRVIIKEEIAGTGLISVPVNLQTGVYLVMVKNNGDVKTEKIYIR